MSLAGFHGDWMGDAENNSYEYLFYYGKDFWGLYCRDPKRKKYKFVEFDEPMFDKWYELYPEYEGMKRMDFRFYLRDVTGKIPSYQHNNPVYQEFRDRLGRYIVDNEDLFMYDKLEFDEYEELNHPLFQTKRKQGDMYTYPLNEKHDRYVTTREVEFDMIARLFRLFNFDEVSPIDGSYYV